MQIPFRRMSWRKQNLCLLRAFPKEPQEFQTRLMVQQHPFTTQMEQRTKGSTLQMEKTHLKVLRLTMI